MHDCWILSVRIASDGEARPVAGHGMGDVQIRRTERVSRKERRGVIVAEHEVHLESVHHSIAGNGHHLVAEEIEEGRRPGGFDQTSHSSRLAHVLGVTRNRGQRVFR